ncbi:MAG: DUF3256 family protein, partial [Muribaculaceae bacterium]|nr:DUF3256 family protein [Muribaculaceae bacterium]
MTLSFNKAAVVKTLLMFMCLVTTVTGYADVKESQPLTASKVFAEIPLEVLDMLRQSTRLDMIDYYSQADSLVTVQDALGGQSRLQQVESDYLKVSVTPVSTLEIKLLPAKKDQIIMTLYTVGNDSLASDTQVKFFDSALKPLSTEKYLKTPVLKDFFTLKNSGLSASEVAEKIPFEAIVYSTGPGDTPLTATLTTLKAISKEDRDLLTPLLA